MLLLQAAAQHLPPINITVQQPAGGMPEWVKILISAGVGALFGVLGSVMMEFVKPAITKRLMKKRLSAQVVAEVTKNLNMVDSICRLFQSIEGGTQKDYDTAMNYTCIILQTFNTDRFDYYFANQKELIYEIDITTHLGAFYVGLKGLKDYSSVDRLKKDLPSMAEVAYEAGCEFLKQQGRPFQGRQFRGIEAYEMFATPEPPSPASE
jgi:hypothetical protein